MPLSLLARARFWVVSLAVGPEAAKAYQERAEAYYAEQFEQQLVDEELKMNRGEFRGAFCAKYWRVIQCLGAVCALLGGFLMAHSFYRDSQTSIGVVAGIERDFVRHGDPGINLRVPSEDFTCQQLHANATGARPPLHAIGALQDVLEAKLTDARVCVCAPQVGVRRKLLALAWVNGTTRFLFNPQIDETWQGEVANKPPMTIRHMLSRESQAFFFPEHTGDVEVPRQRPVRVLYRDANCQSRAVVLDHRFAYCAQSCVDLFHGVSVYDRAAQGI